MPVPPPKPPQRPGVPNLAKSPPAAEDALARSRREKDELAAEVQGIEDELEELKAKYEQYFLGVERREPGRWREELKKKVLRLKTAFTRNAALRFRIQSLNARYLSYERLWLRSAREKEDGTYRRDLFKARLRATPAEAPPATSGPAAPAPTPTPVPKETRAGTPTAVAARAVGPAGAVADAQMRALYDAYVAAKKRCNEDVSRLTYEAVAKSVSKQVPELMTRFKAKSVDFKVEVKDGKAVLKAVPKV